MAEKISWTLNVQVAGGPKVSASKTMIVDAYDKIEVEIPANADGQGVQVQPGDAGQVQFLLIGSDWYSAEGADLSYSVNAKVADAEGRIKLDSMQIFVGDGAVGLLNDKSPTTLFLYNLSPDKPATITILVGRKVLVKPIT